MPEALEKIYGWNSTTRTGPPCKTPKLQDRKMQDHGCNASRLAACSPCVKVFMFMSGGILMTPLTTYYSAPVPPALGNATITCIRHNNIMLLPDDVFAWVETEFANVLAFKLNNLIAKNTLTLWFRFYVVLNFRPYILWSSIFMIFWSCVFVDRLRTFLLRPSKPDRD